MNTPIYWNISWTLECIYNFFCLSEENNNKSLKLPDKRFAKILKKHPNIIYHPFIYL